MSDLMANSRLIVNLLSGTMDAKIPLAIYFVCVFLIGFSKIFY